jgi:hypothetical protein
MDLAPCGYAIVLMISGMATVLFFMLSKQTIVVRAVA